MIQPVAPLTDREFVQFQRFIHEAAGISLTDAKKPLVSGRLAKRLHHLQFNSYSSYFQLISSGGAPEETQIAIDLLTTNETYFFREARHFEHLRSVLRERRPGSAPFRVWSAACSTGEEPYSIAMVLADLLAPQSWEVLASDIKINQHITQEDHVELVQCRQPRGIQVDLGEVHAFAQHARNQERAVLNIDAFQAKAAQIVLRNVLIYFDVDTKRRVAQRVLDYLRPGGYLYIGHSESLHDMGLPVRGVAPAIYRKE